MGSRLCSGVQKAACHPMPESGLRWNGRAGSKRSRRRQAYAVPALVNLAACRMRIRPSGHPSQVFARVGRTNKIRHGRSACAGKKARPPWRPPSSAFSAQSDPPPASLCRRRVCQVGDGQPERQVGRWKGHSRDAAVNGVDPEQIRLRALQDSTALRKPEAAPSASLGPRNGAFRAGKAAGRGPMPWF